MTCSFVNLLMSEAATLVANNESAIKDLQIMGCPDGLELLPDFDTEGVCNGSKLCENSKVAFPLGKT